MKITHCKLNKSIQNKLLEFFVLEVTARAAAYLLGIHANSAILFFRKKPKHKTKHKTQKPHKWNRKFLESGEENTQKI